MLRFNFEPKRAMSKIRILLEILLVLCVIAFASAFVYANEQTLIVDFLAGAAQMSSGTALLSMFIVGGLLGFIVRLPSILSLKAKLLKAQRTIAQQDASNHNP